MKKQFKGLVTPVFVVLLMIAVLLTGCADTKLNEDEELAYNSVEQLKKMLKNPDHLSLYDEFYVFKHLDENNHNDYTYTFFKYRVEKLYGDEVMTATGQAIFKDGEYIMDYGEEIVNPKYTAAEYREYSEAKKEEIGEILKENKIKAKVKLDIAICEMIADADSLNMIVDNSGWEVVEIDVEKINKKMSDN
ncbi:MAG: hypothetical protein IKV97_05645 [Clostridia bacterium]|nr:hypothetical protein [Clostridia bacterium]